MRRTMRTAVCAAVIGTAMAAGTGTATATETEHFGIRVLPTPRKVVVDGKVDDWDLSGGVFVCGDAENHRGLMAVWFHVMYDADFLHVLGRWVDPTPMNNPGSSKGDFPFAGDCLQFRTITAEGKPEEKGLHFSAWQDRDGIGQIKVELGKTFKEGVLADAQSVGAKQAFAKDADGKGYVQEIAIPWSLLTRDGKPLKAGDSFVLTVEPNFTVGVGGRFTIKDLFRPGSNIDRIFTFMAFPCWGPAVLEAKGPVKPQPVRLSDAREFAVSLEGGKPVVDWTGLIRSREPEGFKSIPFEMPQDGYVSLHLRNSEGQVVRHLLGTAFRTRGKHEVKWDGLTTPWFRKPGEVLPAGTYTWHAIAHPGIGLRLRGWASNGGSTPWDNGPGTNWGGDHGVPVSAAADAGTVYLGWSGSEAGRGLVACDLEGRAKWKHTRGAFGGATFVASDQGTVYVVDAIDWSIYCLDARSGSYSDWAGSGRSDVRISSLWQESGPMPDRATGFDVVGGKAYLACPLPGVQKDEVADWPKFLARLKDEAVAGREPAQSLWSKLDAGSVQRIEKALAAADPALLEPRPGQTDVRESVAKLLKAVPRPQVAAAFPGLVAPAKGEFVAVVDVKTGKVLKSIPVPEPGRLDVAGDDRVYVLSGGTKLLRIDPQTGATDVVLDGLTKAVGVAVDGEGRIHVGCGAPDHQVKVYTPDGRFVRAVGKAGGRPALGPWEPDAFRDIAGIAVDAKGVLWVTESLSYPKRVSRWDADGKLLREFFGPTHYGASGGTIHPRDPDTMIGEGCEWKIDPQHGGHRCVGVFDHADHGCARFCTGSGGQDVLAVNTDRGQTIKFFERLAPGRYALRAVVERPAGKKHLRFWSDADGDGREQETEVRTLDRDLRFESYVGWSMPLNTDLTLYAGGPQSVQIRPGAPTKCGAPTWDLDDVRPIPTAGLVLSSLDNRLLCAMPTGGPRESVQAFDLATGRLLWDYPNQWFGVHGSHHAPPPESGLLRGTFGFIGSAKLPEPIGDLFVVNSNCGEYHAFTGSGFYLTRLFQPDPLKLQFPDKPVPGAILDNVPPGMGGEDFGGSLVQGRDGKVYVQSGKTALWNVEVVGLDAVRTVPGSGGKVVLGGEDVVESGRIRERLQQEATGSQQYVVRRATPQFTGATSDFKGLDQIRFRKQDEAEVHAVASWDDSHLHLAWQVMDRTPWVNGAPETSLLYLGGDTVDFQLGTDPQAAKDRKTAVAGDLRLSIGPFQGKPTAVLYRKVSATKKPRLFNSGVIQNYEMEFVDVLPDVRIEVKVSKDRGYTVEASVPLAKLGLKPTPGLVLKGDFGVTHGDPAGQRTRLRTHWNNQSTGIVDDAVFELQMEPQHWGTIVFQQ